MLTRRANRSIRHQLDGLVRRGELRALLPGVYTAPEPTWQARIRAAAAFRPDGVIGGAAAALLLWWPECPIKVVAVATHRKVSVTAPGFGWERRRVPPELIVDRGSVRIASPALSVLDLIPDLGGNAIDEALRRGAATLADLRTALGLTRGRTGNPGRLALIEDSRDSPWSEAERLAHRLLREAGITGWRTNHRVMVNGVGFVVDLVFQAERIAIEVDGWTYHGSRQAFVADRWRYARLASAGWRVLPFAASELTDYPEEFVGVVRDALRTRL